MDGGTSRFDENGVIYQAICASCGNTSPFPTTPGAWATTKPAVANCNLALVKIAFDLAGVGSGMQSWIDGVPRDTAGCVPLTVDFKDTVLKQLPMNGILVMARRHGPSQRLQLHAYIYNCGTYHVTLVAVDSSTCNIRDTSYMFIKVGSHRSAT